MGAIIVRLLAYLMAKKLWLSIISCLLLEWVKEILTGTVRYLRIAR